MKHFLNKGKETLKIIKDNLYFSNKIDFAVSYIQDSGLEQIKSELQRLDRHSRIILTLEGKVTDPDALQFLFNLPIKVKVFLEKNGKTTNGFHGKNFIFYQQDKVVVMNGSSNISHTAFFENYEIQTLATYPYFSKFDAQEIFEELWEVATELTQKIVEDYKNSFIKNFISRKPQLTSFVPNIMQEEALFSLKELRNNNQTKALVIASTGTGKTLLSAFDVKEVNPKKTLFIVHNRMIIKDAIKTYKNVFSGTEKVIKELFSHNINELDNYDIVFTTPQIVNNYLLKEQYKYNYFNYIIIDENHKSGAESYLKILNYLQADFLLGMSATPERSDGKDIYGLFDNNIALEIRLNEALDKELVSPFKYFAIDSDVIDNENKIRINEANAVKVSLNIEKEINEKGFFGNKLKALVFVYKTREADLLAEAFNDYTNFKAEAVHSNNNDLILQENLIERLQDDNDDLEILVVVNKFNEGVDIPSLNTVVMTRYTESSIIFIQQIGRGLRKQKNKYLTILDFIGNYKTNFEVIKAITGVEVNDKVLLTNELKNDFPSSSEHVEINLTEVSKRKILTSIKKITTNRKQLISNTLTYLYNKENDFPTLEKLEENGMVKLRDVIQLNKSYYEAFNFKDKVELTNEEIDFIRYIQKFPFTVSSLQDKKEILELLTNGEVIFTNKRWEDYFDGSVKVEGMTYSKKIMGKETIYKNIFFKKNDEKIIMVYKTINTTVKQQLEMSIKFLQELIKIEKNDFLVLNQKYKREEFLFMFNKKAWTNDFRGEVPLDNGDMIYIVDVESGNSYDNQITSANEGIFSTREVSKEKNKEYTKLISNKYNNIYVFVQNKNFSKKTDGNRYIYLGNVSERKMIGKIDNKFNNKSRTLFSFSFSKELTKIQLEELNWIN